MSAEEAFLADIVEHPEDDAPRLVYADWLDEHGRPERAEFIRAQVELARAGEDDPGRDRLVERERQLLDAHGTAWRAELPGWARKGCVFRRGFVEQVTATVAQFVKQAHLLWRQTPAFHVRLKRAFGHADALAASPHLARVTALDLGADRYRNLIGDEGVRALASSPHLARLTALDLAFNGVTAAGARALAQSPYLTRLTTLKLSGHHDYSSYNRVGSEGARALAASPHLARLSALYLADNGIGTAGAKALAASPHLTRLTTLDLTDNPIGAAGALALAGSPGMARLTTLSLGLKEIGPAAAEALAASPHRQRLTALDLKSNEPLNEPAYGSLRRLLGRPECARFTRLTLNLFLGGLGVRVLDSPHLCRLTELSLFGNGFGADEARALVALPALGGLTSLNVGWNNLGDAGAEALAASPRLARLRSLNLCANGIHSAGAQALAASPHLARLRELQLSFNRIGDAGAEALAASPHLAGLTRLQLGSNPFHKAARYALAQRFGDRLDVRRWTWD